MTHSINKQHRSILQSIAHRVMLERGLLPDFQQPELSELARITRPAVPIGDTIRDLRELKWCSIDNHDSLDLDQLTYAEPGSNGDVKIMVAIADVDALVKPLSALDEHAKHNTTSIYTAAEMFPMLPEKLSTDLTSLGYRAERLTIVIEMVIAKDGSVKDANIYQAYVKNWAKLQYNSVAQWLDGIEPMPQIIGEVRNLEENLRIQDRVAQAMKELRHEHGALALETIEARPVFEKEEIKDLIADKTDRAKDIISDFMIAANGVVARYLTDQWFPTLRRVVRTPERWDRIVELAAEHGYKLPIEPDSKALNLYLLSAKSADPVRFSDLCLSVIKLMGAGEYVVEAQKESTPGHFGLAVKDYTHSTAPNRRYPDLITQRLLKAAIQKKATPYSNEELIFLAKHCTQAEDNAKKVERQVGKSAAALLLESRIGESFEGIVTGASNKGTWVRLLHPPVEGKLIEGYEGVDVGHKITVQLVSTDVQLGFIDFKKVTVQSREGGSLSDFELARNCIEMHR
jgi:VacB/RNase II family 3'-5' exoribonuclease